MRALRNFLVILLSLQLALPAVYGASPSAKLFHPEDLGLTVNGVVQKILSENPGKTIEQVLDGERVVSPEGLEYLLIKTTAPLKMEVLNETGQRVKADVQFEFEVTEAETHADLQLFIRRLESEKGLSPRGLPMNLIDVRSELAPRFPLLDQTIRFLQTKFSMEKITWKTDSKLEDPTVKNRPVGLTIARVLVNGSPTFVGVLVAGGGVLPALLAGYTIVGALSGGFMYFNREAQSFVANQVPSTLFSSEKVRQIIQTSSWLSKHIDLSKYTKPLPSTEFSSYLKWGLCLEFAFAGLATVGLYSLGLDVKAGQPFSEWATNAIAASALENLFYAGLATWGQGTWDLAITAEREALLRLNDRLLSRGEISEVTHKINQQRIQKRSDFQSAHTSFASVGTLGIGKVVPGMKAVSFISFLMMGGLGFMHYQRIKRRYPWYFEMKEKQMDQPLLRPQRMRCQALFQ